MPELDTVVCAQNQGHIAGELAAEFYTTAQSVHVLN